MENNKTFTITFTKLNGESTTRKAKWTDKCQEFVAKANVITCHQKWIDSIEKQKSAMKTGLKAYRYLSEGVELMKELGIELDEAELVRCNSTGLTIYNPQNLASMIKGMKNTTITREQKIALRQQYEAQNKIN